MRLVSIMLIGAFALLSTVVDENSGTLMLSSILMALKSGYWAGKLGMGGLFAMMAAKNYEQQRAASGAGPSPTLRGLSQLFSAASSSSQTQSQTQVKPLLLTPSSLSSSSASRKRFRYTRSVTNFTDLSPPLVAPPLIESKNVSSPITFINGTSGVNGKLSIAKSNMTTFEIMRANSIHRVVRQLGVLERLSCLPKLLCGLETKEPSTKTTALNDYGSLVKLLFGREDDAEVDDDDDEEQDDDDGRAAMDTDSDPDSDQADTDIETTGSKPQTPGLRTHDVVADHDGPIIGMGTVHESLDDHHLPPIVDVDDESVKQMAAVLNSGKRNNKYRVNKNRGTKTKTKKTTTTTTQKPKNEDSDESTGADDHGDEEDKSGEGEDYTEFDEIGQGALSWRDMAQDQLMNDEPELLTYALMELSKELKQKKEAVDKERKQNGQPSVNKDTTQQGRQDGSLKNSTGGGANNGKKNYRKKPSSSSSYRSPGGGGKVKYQVISPGDSMVQSPYDPYPIQYPESYNPKPVVSGVGGSSPLSNSKNIIDKLNKNIRNKFGFGFASNRPQSGTVLETLLPSSIYNTFKSYLESEYEIPPAGFTSETSKNGHYHRRRRRPAAVMSDNPYLRYPRSENGFEVEEEEDAKLPNGEDLDGGRNGVAELPQRINSRFRRLEEGDHELEFMERKARQLENASDPLTKYRVALETGKRTKSARQCRLLFSRCPYKYSEIKQLIDNAKEFLDSTATVGDKVVPLKKKGTSKLSNQRNKGKPAAAEGGGGGGIVAGSLDADSVVQLLGPLAAAAAAAKRANKTAASPRPGGGTTTATMGMGALSTFVMQQLPNGDFEIKLKVKPKQDMVEIQMGGLAVPILESPPVPIAPPPVAPAATSSPGPILFEKIEKKDDPKPILLVNGTRNSTTLDDLWRLIDTDDNSTVQVKSTINIKSRGGGGGGGGGGTPRDVELTKADKAFSTSGKKHDLMGIEYPPEPPVLAPVPPVGHIPDLFRAAVLTGGTDGNLGRDLLDGGGGGLVGSLESSSSSKEKINKKVRPPSHLLPPRPSAYKIVRKRVGRPTRREDYSDEK